MNFAVSERVFKTGKSTRNLRKKRFGEMIFAVSGIVLRRLSCYILREILNTYED